MNNFGELFLPKDINERIDDIVGYNNQKSFLHDFYSALKSISEIQHSEEGLPFGITLSALLTGPPGTGKTTLSKAFAKKYKTPIYLIYADSLIGSILGKTLSNIKQALTAAHNYAKTEGPIIVFFDELDAIASERSSVYEVGEIKRAVVTLLQRMDTILISKDPIAFLGATNHQHLLDSAVWRRFCYHISFDFPDKEMRKSIMENFLKMLKKSVIQTQISDFQLDSLSDDSITGGFTGADLKRGFQIGLLRGFKDKILDDNILSESLISAGGTMQHIDNEKMMSGRTILESDTSTSNGIPDRKNPKRDKKIF